MASKFTTESVDYMVGTYMASAEADYDTRMEAVKAIAAKLEVADKAVIGKLVAEGVYKAKETEAKASTAGTKKEDYVSAFEASFGMKISSMKNMSKKDLEAFWGRFVEMSAVRDADEGKS